MNISENKNLVILTSVIITNGIYILFWIFWLLNDGFKFIGKILALLFWPPLLFNLHWGTEWVSNKVFYALIILAIFLITSFLLWKLNIKVFREKKAKQIAIRVLSLIYILFFVWLFISGWVNFSEDMLILFGERAINMFYNFTRGNLILLGIFGLIGCPIYRSNKKIFKK